MFDLKIDVHTHILPEKFPNYFEKFGYGDFVHMKAQDSCSARILKSDGSLFRKVEKNCWDPESRKNDMISTGVHVQILSTVPVMFSYFAKPEHGLEVSQFLNDSLASVVKKHPTRFAGLATAPMQDPRLTVKELERVLRLGLLGLQIGSNINGDNLDHEKFYPLYEAAESLEAPLFIHPWNMLGADRTQDYWLSWLVGMPSEMSHCIATLIFGGVFERFPKLRFGFAHGGGSFSHNFGRIKKGFEARPDLCAVRNKNDPSKYLGHFYVDSLVHSVEAFETTLKLFGEDKIFLGSDYPFPLGEDSPGALLSKLNLSEERRQKILSKNAMGFLGPRFNCCV